MKKITISTVLLTLVLLVVSCSEDEENLDENLLLGTWLITRETDSDGEDETYESGCRNQWQIENNTITASYDDDCDGAFDDSFSANYTLVDNELVLENGGDTDERAFVRSLTETNLVIEIRDDFDPDDRYSYTLYFDRIE